MPASLLLECMHAVRVKECAQCKNTLPADHPLCLANTAESWPQQTDQLAKLHGSLRVGRPAKVGAMEVQPDLKISKLESVQDPGGTLLSPAVCQIRVCIHAPVHVRPTSQHTVWAACKTLCSLYLCSLV